MLKSVYTLANCAAAGLCTKSACTNVRNHSPVGNACWTYLGANTYDDEEGRTSKRLLFFTTVVKVSINYYDVDWHILLCILYIILYQLLLSLLYFKYHAVLFLSSFSTQYHLLYMSFIIFTIHVYKSPAVCTFIFSTLMKRMWLTGLSYSTKLSNKCLNIGVCPNGIVLAKQRAIEFCL